MTETKWTKGPWKSEKSEPVEGFECFWVTPVTRGDFSRDIGTVNGPHNDEQAANAHLIAAAPTMAGYIKRKADEGCEEAARIWEQINAC